MDLESPIDEVKENFSKDFYLKQWLLRPGAKSLAKFLSYFSLKSWPIKALQSLSLPFKIGIVSRLSFPAGTFISKVGRIKYAFDFRYDICKWTMFNLYESYDLKRTKKLIRRGDTCLDIGANFGVYALNFASLGADVHAFEPSTLFSNLLRKNASLNDFSSKLHIHQMAIADSPGRITITFYDETGTCEDLGRAGEKIFLSRQPEPIKEEVEQLSVDAFFEKQGLEHARLIKVDIDGGERALLAGASGVLAKAKADYFLLEYSQELADIFKYSIEDIVNIFAQYDYDFIKDKNYKKFTSGKWRGIPTINLLFKSPKAE